MVTCQAVAHSVQVFDVFWILSVTFH